MHINKCRGSMARAIGRIAPNLRPVRASRVAEVRRLPCGELFRRSAILSGLRALWVGFSDRR